METQSKSVFSSEIDAKKMAKEFPEKVLKDMPGHVCGSLITTTITKINKRVHLQVCQNIINDLATVAGTSFSYYDYTTTFHKDYRVLKS